MLYVGHLLVMDLLSNGVGKMHRNREIKVQRKENQRIKRSLLHLRRSLQKRNDQGLVRRVHKSARKQTPQKPRRMRITASQTITKRTRNKK